MSNIHRTSSGQAKRQTGATLIEILVSVLILSIGLLSMIALQTRALQGNVSAGQRGQAIVYAQSILDVMRVDDEKAINGDYDTGTNPVCYAATFGSGTLAKNSLTTWLTEMKASMGAEQTCGWIQCSANRVCTVRVYWDDTAAGGLERQTVEVESRI
jgi:type IV pilus assembly protein PilV